MTPLANQPHKPSRKQAILFLLASLLLALAVLAWVFFINKGTLTVTGEPPFSVSAGSQKITCQIASCSFRLAPRTYSVAISKEGFFDNSQTIKISRGKEIKITAQLKLIPVIKDLGAIVLPIDSAPLHPPFLGSEKLANFPKNVEYAVFSDTENQAMLTIGPEIYLYDVKEKTTLKTSLDPKTDPTWVNNKIVFLENEDDKQVLKLRENNKENKTLVSFQRPFKNPRLLGAPTLNKILIEDTEDEARTYYMIDLDQQSRKRLDLAKNAKAAKWTLKHIIFKVEDADGEKTLALDAETLATFALPTTDAENILEPGPDVFLLLTVEKKNAGASDVGVPISEAIEQAKHETLKLAENVSTVSKFVTEFNISGEVSHSLIEIPLQDKEEIHRLTADPSGKKLYFTKGEKAFEIVLE